MTPDHPRWSTFAGRVADVYYRAEQEGAGCQETLAMTGAVLETLPNVEVAASLAVLQAGGCRCDCDVVNLVVLPWLLGE